MIVFQPNALYTRQDLADLLCPIGIDPDAFVKRVRPVKRFRMAWWGGDLIRAIDQAPVLGEAPEISARKSGPSHRRNEKDIEEMLAPLRRLESAVKR